MYGDADGDLGGPWRQGCGLADDVADRLEGGPDLKLGTVSWMNGSCWARNLTCADGFIALTVDVWSID